MPPTTGLGSRVDSSFWYLLAGVLMHAGIACYGQAQAYSQAGAIGAMTLAIGVAARGLYFARSAAGWERRAAEVVLWGLVAWGLAALPWGAGMIRDLLGSAGAGAVLGVAASAAVLGAAWRCPARWRPVLLGGTILVSGLRNYLDMTRYPESDFDVILWHQEGVDRLLRGENPFLPPYVVHTPVEINLHIYAPDQVDGQRIMTGFPYPPVSLLAAVPGTVLAGDYRIIMLVSVALLGVLLYCFRPDRTGLGAAMALLLSPGTSYMLFFGWTEALCAALFAGMVAVMVWRPAMGSWAYGLFVGSKQTMVLTAPAMWLYLRDRAPEGGLWRWALKAGALAAVFLVPFFLWAPREFWVSLVGFQLKQPFRMDSISYAPWLFPATEGGKRTAALLALGLYLGSLGWAGWRRSVAGSLAHMSALSAVSLGVYFLFNKQAFCNYYFFCAALLLVAGQVGRREAAEE